MTPVTIANKAQLAVSRRKSSRVLTFEDGISRHITLTTQQWEDLDALIAGGWTKQQLLWVPFDSAREAYEKGQVEDFEDELRRCMVTMAKGAWVWHPDRKKQRPSNRAIHPAD